MSTDFRVARERLAQARRASNRTLLLCRSIGLGGCRVIDFEFSGLIGIYWWLSTIHGITATTAIATAQTRNRDFVNGRTPRSFPGQIAISAGDGRRSINRSQTVLVFKYIGDAPGVAAMNAASLLAAGTRSNRVSLAASSQGSMPSRESTDRTLSGAASLSSSMRANRKSSN
jgi:hypothetical protein